MNRVIAATIVLVIAASLSGCGGGESNGADPQPSASATSSAAAEAWSKQEAGRRYASMAKPTNEAIKALNNELQSGSSTYESVAPLCKAEESTTDTFMRKLDAGRWPSDVRDAVDTVLAQLAAVRGALTRCATSSSDEVTQAALTALDDAAKSNASQLLRVKLGLPSV